MMCAAAKFSSKTERSSLSVNKKEADSGIEVGTLVAPHGVRGDLRIKPSIERPEILRKLSRIYIDGAPRKLLFAKPHKNIYILHLEGCDDRNAAEALIGKKIFLPEGDFPRLAKGEYYFFQLLGLSVSEEDGTPVGTLTEIMETGANDVYAVETEDGKEILIPAIPDCIKDVDLEKHIMTVHLLEWE